MLIQQFRYDNYRLHQLGNNSVFTLTLQAGLSAIKTPYPSGLRGSPVPRASAPSRVQSLCGPLPVVPAVIQAGLTYPPRAGVRVLWQPGLGHSE